MNVAANATFAAFLRINLGQVYIILGHECSKTDKELLKSMNYDGCLSFVRAKSKSKES